MIEIYFWPTPNSKKVTIFLEESGLEYRITELNIIRGDQFQPAYLKLNPNHRMPTIVDHDPADGGEPVAVFESGAILLYLAEKTGMFQPKDLRGRHAANQWLFWQMANFGPKIGEYNYFRRAGPEAGDQSHALRRYADETNRLYGVLNYGLYDREYLAGDEYSIADMAVAPWALNWEMHGQDLDEFKHVKRWLALVGAREGVKRGLAVGAEMTIDPTKFSPEEMAHFRKLLFNQRAIPAPDEPARG